MGPCGPHDRSSLAWHRTSTRWTPGSPRAQRSEGCSEDSHLLWGLVILVKGTVTVWLPMSLSTVHFVLIKGGAILTLTLLADATTVVWSVIVGRHEGLLRRAWAPLLGMCAH
jgi:hypothetical protein